MSIQDLQGQFTNRFHRSGRLFSAPGRVNLIGEHTDYNEGFVLPIAVDKRTYVMGAPRTDRIVSVQSLNAEGAFEFDLDHQGPPRRGIWLDYVEGTAQAMLAGGLPVTGADLLVWSEVPSGAGLSSSAALEIAVAYALARLAGARDPDLVGLALCGQSAEHVYVGAMCGIMDQYISALGKADCALLIDCRSLATHDVALRLGTARLLICDTRIKHQHASSAYNERRAQCELAVAWMRARWPEIRSLRDVTLGQFETIESSLPQPVRQRSRHVISENERTLRAAAALQAGELAELGALMSASHRSLRDDYEVSSKELNEAVNAALAEPGVYGARMTGGGFGGCSISLLESSAVQRVSEAIRNRFACRFGWEPALFCSPACAGVREHHEPE